MLKLLLLLSAAISSVPTFLLSECIYFKPKDNIKPQVVFDKLIEKSDKDEETFQNLLSMFEEGKRSVYRYEFRFLIGDRFKEETFFKVMEINAQQAHRFVPMYANSIFIMAKHLGFARKLEKKDGSSVWEHVLIDTPSKSILFVEEKEKLSNGKYAEGSFAALNTIIQESGKSYFVGIYYFGKKPSQKEIEETKQMFFDTHNNMMVFMQDGKVDEIYDTLKTY